MSDLDNSLAAVDSMPMPPDFGPVVTPPSRVVKLRCGADIEAQAITWLWDKWLPSGKLTILAGTAGTGKTTLAVGLAAALTSGGRWPDGKHCKQRGNVLIWSSEDNPDDTLVPRLIASGADMNRCHFIDGIAENGVSVPFDPAQDIPELNKAVERIGGVKLLIIDPIVSAVSGDMHRANDVRRSLQAVVDFASMHECAVIGITHFAKGGAGTAPQDRVIGSQAFAALARMVLVAAKEEDGSKRVLARAKSNIAPDDGGVSYSLDVTTIAGDIETTRVMWHGILEGTAREILGDVEFNDSEDAGKTSEKAGAESFLTEALSDGPLSAKKIKAMAADAGYTWPTLRRAKSELEITSKRYGGTGKDGYWAWSMPDDEREPEATETAKVLKFPKGFTENSVSTLGKNEHLSDEVANIASVSAEITEEL